jgi:hypothetical protein
MIYKLHVLYISITIFSYDKFVSLAKEQFLPFVGAEEKQSEKWYIL